MKNCEPCVNAEYVLLRVRATAQSCVCSQLGCVGNGHVTVLHGLFPQLPTTGINATDGTVLWELLLCAVKRSMGSYTPMWVQ
jgi:hypothetical protein